MAEKGNTMHDTDSDWEEDDVLVAEERAIYENRSFPKALVIILTLLCAVKVAFYELDFTFVEKSTDTDYGGNYLSLSWTEAPAPRSSSIAPATSTSRPSAPTASPWPYRSYRTETFTSPELRVEKSGDTAPGLLFLGPRGNGTHSQGPMIMAEDGELVWHGPSGTTTNLMLQDIGDEQRMTFWQGDSAFTYGHGYGGVHILNDSYDLVALVCPEDMDIVTEAPDAQAECRLDMHESFVTSRGTLITTAYNVTQTDLRSIAGLEDGWVYDSMFYEFDVRTQKTLFHWRSLDHLDQIPLYETKYPLAMKEQISGSSQAKPFDYFHINSVQALDDGGYLVNSRHMWSVFKVAADGQVEWQLKGDGDGGDFVTEDDVRFSWQHDSRAANVTSSWMHINMFSNANSEAQEESKDSKGLEIFLDLEAREARVLRSLVDEKDQRHSKAMGSWQSLADEHILVGYGKDATIKEFNELDECVWTGKFGNTTEGNGGSGVVASYRVYKFEWTAKPNWRPKLVVEYRDEQEMTWLYASWNGATPDAFDNWVVRAGRTAEKLVELDDVVVAREGFETKFMLLRGGHDYYQVTARLGNETLSSSAVVEAMRI